MANYPFKINITTKDDIKISFYTGSFATSADTVVSASVMVDRINNMKSGSNFVDSIEAPTSLATHGSTLYGATVESSGNNGIHWLSASFDHPNTGSITFTDTETAASGGLDFYTFHGTKVCSVLGIPEGIPIYTENFKLSDSSTDTTNYISGEFISDSISLKKGLKMSSQARMRSNLVWDDAFGEGFVQWVSGSDSKMSIGYDNVGDVYRVNAPQITGSIVKVTNKLTMPPTTFASRFTSSYFSVLDINFNRGTVENANPFSGGALRVSAGNEDDDTYMIFKHAAEPNGPGQSFIAFNPQVDAANDVDFIIGDAFQGYVNGVFDGNSFYGDSEGGFTVGHGDFSLWHDYGNDVFNLGKGTDISGSSTSTITTGNVTVKNVLAIPGFANVSASLADATGGGSGGITNFGLNGTSGATQTITDGNTLTIAAGNGISTVGSSTDTITVSVGAAQTTITSLVNSSLEIGRDADNRIKFGTDNQIIFEVAGGDNVIMKSSGEIEATTLDISGNITAVGTGSFAGLVIGGGTFTSASLAAGGGGSGDVSVSGTPANNQLAIWTDASTIEGDASLTFDGQNMQITDAGAQIQYQGTHGGGGEGITYEDSGGNGRYAFHFPGSDVVVVSNRASDGVVQIRANTSSAGSAGERTVAIFEDNKVHFGSDVTQISGSSSSTGSFGTVESATNVRAEGDVIAFYSSDERLKDNIKKIEKPIYKLKQLRGVEYEWNNLQGVYPIGSKDSGIIAQDVQKVLPQLVKEKKDGYLGVRHDRLVGLLVESIKEQQQQIDELKKEVQELKNGSS